MANLKMKEAGSSRSDQLHLPASACSHQKTQELVNSDPTLSPADA